MNRAIFFILCLFVFVLIGAAAVYVTYNGPDNLEQRIQNGDIVFQTTRNEQSAAIIAATGSVITHMGIAAKDENGSVSIVETGSVVRSVPLKQWIEKGQAGRVAVKRVVEVDDAKGEKIVAAAKSFTGRPYDAFFYMDDKRLYCSELVYKAYKANDIAVGRVEKVADLNVDNAIAKSLIEKRMATHPLCAKGKEGCWRKIMAEEIVTPSSIYHDESLETIYSNYLF